MLSGTLLVLGSLCHLHKDPARLSDNEDWPRPSHWSKSYTAASVSRYLGHFRPNDADSFEIFTVVLHAMNVADSSIPTDSLACSPRRNDDQPQFSYFATDVRGPCLVSDARSLSMYACWLLQRHPRCVPPFCIQPEKIPPPHRSQPLVNHFNQLPYLMLPHLNLIFTSSNPTEKNGLHRSFRESLLPNHVSGEWFITSADLAVRHVSYHGSAAWSRYWLIRAFYPRYLFYSRYIEAITA